MFANLKNNHDFKYVHRFKKNGLGNIHNLKKMFANSIKCSSFQKKIKKSVKKFVNLKNNHYFKYIHELFFS